MTKLHYSYLYLYGTLPIILALSFHYLTLNAFCFGLLIQNVLVCYCKCWIHSILVDCYIRILVCTYRIFIKKKLRIFEKIASRTPTSRPRPLQRYLRRCQLAVASSSSVASNRQHECRRHKVWRTTKGEDATRPY